MIPNIRQRSFDSADALVAFISSDDELCSVIDIVIEPATGRFILFYSV